MEYFLKDLKKDVAERVGCTQALAEEVLRTAFDIIGDKLVEGKKVYLIDFVNFEVRNHKEKHVKNPKTGEPMVIPAYKSLRCTPTKAMKRKLGRQV